ILELETPNTNFVKFYYTFPSGLKLASGLNYNFYFETIDNDGIHNGKVSQSQIFTTRLLNENELRNEELNAQQAIVKGMDKTLEKFREQRSTFKDIGDNQKEKKSLNFNDKSKISDFLEAQRQHENRMKKFSE